MSLNIVVVLDIKFTHIKLTTTNMPTTIRTSDVVIACMTVV